MDETPRIGRIACNGAIAYKEGTVALDCPYMEEDPDFTRWNNEWDEAADVAEEEKAVKPNGIGSVVTNRYRARYAELGHPTHCGDELAALLNNLCQNKAGTNLEMFEAICAANGVNLSKYGRTQKGWQGRIRMTGRNMLAKKVYEQQGVLFMPEGMMPDKYILDMGWVADAKVKYKPKV